MNYFQQPLAYPQPVGGYYPPVQPILPDPTMGLPNEQSYIENILRLNLGKVCTIYMNFENSQWGSKIFKGILKGAGKDHIVLKDLQSDTNYILLSIYLNYVTFDEDIEYQYPYRKKEKVSSK